jgi:hypothetical protein
MIALALISLFLSACGEEGAFGNNKGPKKPEWANQSQQGLFNQ